MLTETRDVNAPPARGDRRDSERVPSPFDAWRVGSLDVGNIDVSAETAERLERGLKTMPSLVAWSS